MGQRIALQDLLETILGSTHVYFQPPSKLVMSYPCIVYSLSDISASFGDNKPYSLTKKYTVISIDRDPDSLVPMKLAALPQSSFSSYYVADNLNHNAFEITF
jgi:hypothetical protein